MIKSQVFFPESVDWVCVFVKTKTNPKKELEARQNWKLGCVRVRLIQRYFVLVYEILLEILKVDGEF